MAFYVDSDRPGSLGFHPGMVQVCAERPFNVFYGFTPFPDMMVKAAALLEGIITFHPFIDGNKRVALLATYCFLYWNGYDLTIPENADEFTIEVAQGKHSMLSIVNWILQNTRRNIRGIIRGGIISRAVVISTKWPQLNPLVLRVAQGLVIPNYALGFFRYKLQRSGHKTRVR